MRCARRWLTSSGARTSSSPPWRRGNSDRSGDRGYMMMTQGDDSSPARVVIAEDEAIVRLDLKEILQSAGYDVVGETGRGDEAVKLVEQHQPDLAILDIK